MRVHVCLIDVDEESLANHNCFLEAAGKKVREVPALRDLLQFYNNVDALTLAHELAMDKNPSADVRRVGLLNGANRAQLGNHWFSHGARNAIDENLHRRSGPMAVGSLLLNTSTVPRRREVQEL